MFTKPSVGLSERVEYASAEWLAEAKRFLESASATLPNASFSFSAHLDDPPPHLNGGDGPFGYTIRMAGGTVEAQDRPSDDVDLFQRGDYNAGLPLAWVVYGDDPTGRARIVREYQRLAGDRTSGPVGEMPGDPAVAGVLGALHDHLARRTVNNPDVGHRIKHYGLERHAAELAETGYTVLENAFTDEYALALREETHKNHQGRAEDASFRATMLLERGRIWEEAVIHQWVLTLADHLLGRGNLIYQ